MCVSTSCSRAEANLPAPDPLVSDQILPSRPYSRTITFVVTPPSHSNPATNPILPPATLRRTLRQSTVANQTQLDSLVTREQVNSLQTRLNDFATKTWASSFERDCTQKLLQTITNQCSFDERVKHLAETIQHLQQHTAEKATQAQISSVEDAIKAKFDTALAENELKKMEEKVENCKSNLEDWQKRERERVAQYGLYDGAVGEIWGDLRRKGDRSLLERELGTKAGVEDMGRCRRRSGRRKCRSRDGD